MTPLPSRRIGCCEPLEKRRCWADLVSLAGIAYELTDRMAMTSEAVLVDLDRDGHQDLMRVEVTDGIARLQPEFGSGPAFVAGESIVHPESYVARLIPADWDGDGDADLLSLGSNSLLSPFWLRRWRNEGVVDGQWQGLSDAGLLDFSPQIALNSQPAVLLEDLNGDGLGDLIIGAQQLEVRFSSGPGEYAPPIRYDRVSTGRTVTSGDLDADGDLDLVTAVPGEPGRLSILINDGEGFFEIQSQVTTGQQPWHLALGDVDADGDLDVAMAHRWFDEGLSLWLNQGDGTLDPNRRRFPIAGNPVEIHWADIEGDGDLDLVVATAYAQHVPNWRQVDGGTAVLINEGAGRLASPLYLACCEPLALLVADLDDDGASEIVTIGEKSLVMRTVIESPFVLEAKKLEIQNPLVADSTQTIVTDLNTDGLDDLVTLDRRRQQLLVHVAQPDSTFIRLPPQQVAGTHLFVQPTAISLDLMVATDLDGGRQRLTRWVGQGDGTFVAASSIELPDSLDTRQPQIDFDADGDLDYFVAAPAPRMVLVDADGTFQLGPPLPTDGSDTWHWADLNADQRPDLVLWDRETFRLRTVIQQSEAPFWMEVFSHTTGGPLEQVYVADMDRDGRADLFVNEILASGSQVTLLRQSADQQFSIWETRSIVGPLQEIAAADVDGNGRVDIVATYIDPATDLVLGVITLRQSADESDPSRFAVEEFPLENRNALGGKAATGEFRVSDLNRDGADDVVLPISFWGRTGPQPGGGLVTWMGSFAGLQRPVYQIYEDAGYFQTIQLRERNGDGWNDIIASGDAGIAIVSQQPPATVKGDVTGDRRVDASDLQRFCLAIRDALPPEPEWPAFDLNGDAKIDRVDHAYLIDRVLRTTAGDANLDGLFDSSDLLLIFQAGRFESNSDAKWEEGDWNCDGRFDTADLLAAFQAGSYRPSTT